MPEAFIGWHAGQHNDGFDLTAVVAKIEQLVPNLADGEPTTALVPIHVFWHEWTDPKDHRPEAEAFVDR